FPVDARAGVRVAVAAPRRREQGAIEPGEVRVVAHFCCGWLCDPDHSGAPGRTGQPGVADDDLSAAHDWRAAPPPSPAQRHDETGAGTNRRAGDGNLVPRDVGRKLHWRSCLGTLRVIRATDV